MKKFKILRKEVYFQFVLSSIAVIICLYNIAIESGDDITFWFFIVLFFIGVINLVGFIIRLFLVKHKLNWIYLSGVIFYLLLLYIIYRMKIGDYTLIYYVGIGGVTFNLFYLWYGYFITKNLSAETIETKS